MALSVNKELMYRLVKIVLDLNVVSTVLLQYPKLSHCGMNKIFITSYPVLKT